MGNKIFELETIECDQVPPILEDGKLYLSRVYRTAIHLCACGCGQKTVTPLAGEYKWDITESNGKITLRPSIGNFSGEDPYHAHYFITENKIDWL